MVKVQEKNNWNFDVLRDKRVQIKFLSLQDMPNIGDKTKDKLRKIYNHYNKLPMTIMLDNIIYSIIAVKDSDTLNESNLEKAFIDIGKILLHYRITKVYIEKKEQSKCISNIYNDFTIPVKTYLSDLKDDITTIGIDDYSNKEDIVKKEVSLDCDIICVNWN